MAVLCTLMLVSCVKKTALRQRAGCGHGVGAWSLPRCLAIPCLEENEPCSLCSDMTLNQPKIMKKSPWTSGLNKGLRFYIFIVHTVSVALQLVCLNI